MYATYRKCLWLYYIIYNVWNRENIQTYRSLDNNFIWLK